MPAYSVLLYSHHRCHPEELAVTQPNEEEQEGEGAGVGVGAGAGAGAKAEAGAGAAVHRDNGA